MSPKFDDVRVSVCLSVCLCVCVSRSDRNWTGFETSYGVLRVVNMQKILFSHTFLKKKKYLFSNLFYHLFFLPSFLQSFLVSDSSSSRSSKKMTKTCVSELCLLVYYSRNYRNLFRKCEMPRWCIICWNHLSDSKSLHYFLSNFNTKGPSGHLASRVFSSQSISETAV